LYTAGAVYNECKYALSTCSVQIRVYDALPFDREKRYSLVKMDGSNVSSGYREQNKYRYI
jgi:hypothetical protein